MLVIMLVLALLAVGCFFIETSKAAFQSFVSWGFMLLAGAVAAYAVYLLEAEGKL